MNEDENDTLYSVLANSEIMQHYPLQLFIFRKRQWSTRYTQFAMIFAGVLLGQIPYFCAPFGANTADMRKTRQNEKKRAGTRLGRGHPEHPEEMPPVRTDRGRGAHDIAGGDRFAQQTHL